MAKLGTFELIDEVTSENAIPVKKYKSSQTGLTVTIAAIEGPLVEGYLVLGTEASDDGGLPHTLEHLVFLGSMDYPYKGILDMLANRCLASGTNAWTEIDHTAYTVTTAGSEGFINLLPIYLDHVLFPLLKESSYITEVHHVDGDGMDAGVVYCEMQASETSGESLVSLEMRRHVYPGPCGYKYEVGGILKDIRTITTNEKVKSFHKEFYRPENLNIIVCGSVQPQHLFAAIKPIEEKIIQHKLDLPFRKPWLSEVPPMTATISSEVCFPCIDDQSKGIVHVAWRGPSADELYKVQATMTLLEYLVNSSISPLQKEFIETSEPFASRVGYGFYENSATSMYIAFSNVPQEKLNLIEPKLLDVLHHIYHNSNGKGFDMSRMQDIIHRKKLDHLSKLEISPHLVIAMTVIADFLYGQSREDFYSRLNQIEMLKKLKLEKEEFWLQLLNEYFLTGFHATVRGKPSSQVLEDIAEKEMERIKARKKDLGERGLEVKHNVLMEAIVQNEAPIPPELIDRVSVPSVDNICYHHIKFYSNKKRPKIHELDPHFKFGLHGLHLRMDVDSLRTNFVYMMVKMNTSSINRDLRMYLPLLLELLTESPVKKGDKTLPHEDVIKQLDRDSQQVSAFFGSWQHPKYTCGPFSHLALLSINVEVEKYILGIGWLQDLLYNTVMEKSRVKVIASKMLSNVDECKRNARLIKEAIIKDTLYPRDSNPYCINMFRQQSFLRKVLDRIDEHESCMEVLTALEKAKSEICDISNIAVHMALDANKMADHYHDTEDLAQPWKKIFLPGEALQRSHPPKNPFSIPPDSTLINLVKFNRGYITALGTDESSYLGQVASCPIKYDDPVFPSLMVAVQYLTQLEGPMWRHIRGLGLSYGFSIIVNPLEELIYLNLNESSNIVGAYREAANIIDEYATRKMEISEGMFEAAKSSLIFEIIEKENSITNVIQESLLLCLKGLDRDFNKNLVAMVNKVEKTTLPDAINKYILPLFDPKKSNTAVVCHPSKVEDIITAFKEFNRNLQFIESLEKHFVKEIR